MALDNDDFDDLPSLNDLFSKPIKRTKMVENENLLEGDKENKKTVKLDIKPKPVVSSGSGDLLSPIKVNTPVFVNDLFNHKIVPGIVVKAEKDDDSSLYSVKCYNGKVEKIGRKYIYCTSDTKFYSITPVKLKDILKSKDSIVRPFVKENILKLVEEEEDVLIKILKGEIESERDLIFCSGKRFSMNSENSPGPFTLEEYNFLLEYFPDILIPKVLEDHGAALEERFEKTGKALTHLLRQYSYLVLVPEFTVRHILKMDSSVKTLKEANEKLLNNSTAYDQETGNFINYLYSKQEMYQYARRERSDE